MPQEQSQKTVQEADGTLCPRKPQGYVLLQDGMRTWSHPEHPRHVPSSPSAAQSSKSPMTNPSYVSADFMLCQLVHPWWLHSHGVGILPGCAGITPYMSIPAPLHQQLPIF